MVLARPLGAVHTFVFQSYVDGNDFHVIHLCQIYTQTIKAIKENSLGFLVMQSV